MDRKECIAELKNIVAKYKGHSFPILIDKNKLDIMRFAIAELEKLENRDENLKQVGKILRGEKA